MRDETGKPSKKMRAYPLRYTEDCPPSQKLGEQLKIRFRSSEGFCQPFLEFIATWVGNVALRIVVFGANSAGSSAVHRSDKYRDEKGLD